jgi:carboxymethylenebutenolidase
MSKMITLKSQLDGFEFDALHANALGRRVGGLVLVGEIFGIDTYTKVDVARWAELGFEVIAPSMFDRLERGYSAEHVPEALEKGLRYMTENGDRNPISDVQACVDALVPKGPVFYVGYCYGGTVGYRAASQCHGLEAIVSYYGGGVSAIADLPLPTPIICHFGLNDPYINVEETRQRVAAAHPDVPFYLYENCGHGFNNEGPDADRQQVALARHRSLMFFKDHGAQ